MTVTTTRSETGYLRTVKTDAAGYYSFQNLPIGQYSVRVEAPGFSVDQEDVTLNVAEKGRRDFSLQVGTDQQTVQVQAQDTGLSPDDASIGTVVGQQVIEETPLYLRNWDDLLRIVPGMQISRFTQQSGRPLQAARATSTSTASTPCRTTSSSTASITTPFPKTCRS